MKRFMQIQSAAIFGLLILAISVSTIPASALTMSANQLQTVAATNSREDACQGLNQLGGGGCGSGQSGINNIANAVVTIISYIAGIIAIIMVLIAGIRYTTSGGDSAKVSAAKTALVYALIGIAVAALAQVLVHFVLNQASAA